MVFVVERQATKFLPMKQYRMVPGCGLVYRDHENFPTNRPKVHCSRKFYPPKNTRYTIHVCVCGKERTDERRMDEKWEETTHIVVHETQTTT